jgi:hypothetical protein
MASFPTDSLGECLHCGAGHDTAQCPRSAKTQDGGLGRKTADGRVKALKADTSMEVSRFNSGVAYLENHQSQANQEVPGSLAGRFEKNKVRGASASAHTGVYCPPGGICGSE